VSVRSQGQIKTQSKEGHIGPSLQTQSPNAIRFGLGSVKNVGVAAVDAIVKERGEKGDFKNFIDFLERVSGEAVNKKCIESLIKAGAFDEFEQTRATLINSFESILDTINNSEKKEIKGQVDIFNMDAGADSISARAHMECAPTRYKIQIYRNIRIYRKRIIIYGKRNAWYIYFWTSAG